MKNPVETHEGKRKMKIRKNEKEKSDEMLCLDCIV